MMSMSLKFLYHPITVASKHLYAQLCEEITAQKLSGIGMPRIISYPVEASVAIFVVWALQLYFPHPFKHFFDYCYFF